MEWGYNIAFHPFYYWVFIYCLFLSSVLLLISFVNLFSSKIRKKPKSINELKLFIGFQSLLILINVCLIIYSYFHKPTELWVMSEYHFKPLLILVFVFINGISLFCFSKSYIWSIKYQEQIFPTCKKGPIILIIVFLFFILSSFVFSSIFYWDPHTAANIVRFSFWISFVMAFIKLFISNKILPCIKKSLNWILFFVLFFVIFCGMSAYVLSNYNVNRSIAFCNKLIPKIEAYKRLHGEYPPYIDPLLKNERIPKLLKRDENLKHHSFYYRKNDFFYFSFEDLVYYYYSYERKTGKWTLYYIPWMV